MDVDFPVCFSLAISLCTVCHVPSLSAYGIKAVLVC